MALSPEQWLKRLTLNMDSRALRLQALRSYLDGTAPLPEGAEGHREAYKDFQKKARTNFGELVVDAVAERMNVAGFTVGKETSDDTQIRSIWKRNNLQNGIADVLRDMIGLSTGYVIVGEDTQGLSIVTCEKPEQVITEQDAQFPDRVRAALKIYRDTVDNVDVAFLHLVGKVYTYNRKVTNTQRQTITNFQQDWLLVSEADTGLNFIPVFPFINRGGLGEFESHIDLLDRINWNILQRLVMTAMQAYRQRAIVGELPTVDSDNNEIDYTSIFKASPGAIWNIPTGTSLWESQQTDFSAILNSTKDDIRHLAAVTRTPMSTLIPDAANQSSEGAAYAREGLVFKSNDRISRATAALELALGAALAIENKQKDMVRDIEVRWLPVEHQSMAERSKAATEAQDIPWRKRMEVIWLFSDDEIDEMEAMRVADMKNPALMYPTSGEKITLTGLAPNDTGKPATVVSSTVPTIDSIDPTDPAQNN
jgi:hypothetical protein